MKSMKLAALLLVVAVATSQVDALQGRSLLQSAARLDTAISASSDSSKGSASVASRAKARRGSVKLEARAFSESVEETKAELVEIRTTAVKEVQDGSKVTVVANEAAKAVAKAVAKTLTTVFIVASSTGEENELCADNSASAKAKARSLAEAFVEVFVEAENKEAIADAEATARSIAAATAKAASKASGNACLKGEGRVKVFQSSFAKAVGKAYASVIANALGEVDGESAISTSETDAKSGVEDNVEVGGTSDNAVDGGKGEANSIASGDGSAGKIEPCTGKLETCCARGKPAKSNRCKCGFKCVMKSKLLGGSTYSFELVRAPKGLKKGHTCTCSF